MARGHVNLHRGLGPGELPRRYRRLRDEEPERDEAAEAADIDPDGDYDDYWNPWNQTSPMDFALERLWHDLAEAAVSPKLDLRGLAASEPERAEVRVHDADELVEALAAHVARLALEEEHAVARAELAAPLGALRDAAVREPGLSSWIARHRGPTLMLLLFAPFWVRSPASWSAPAPPDEADTADAADAAIGRALLEHLFGRYPIPPALFVPWRTGAMPGLKWVTWLVLIGGGASLRRAGARFGWQVPARLVHHLFDAPPNLEPVEAILWAELAQRGGTLRELLRLRTHPAFLLDTTVTTDPLALLPDDQRERPERHRGFLLATADWLVRHRDELLDGMCGPILDWAMHRFTEDLARDRPAHACFAWTGRTPAAAHEDAHAYRRQIRGYPPYGYATPRSWPARGWDWSDSDGEAAWTARELTSSSQLADESLAMRHCVGSYSYRCTSGLSAIFSLRRDDARVLTIELEPSMRRVVQARGVANRAATAAELAVVARWLAALPAAPA